MATIVKDRSVLQHRGYYTVHLGNDRTGKIVGSITKAPGRGTFWKTRILNAWTHRMEDDLGFLSFAAAKAYALAQAAILEN